MDLTLRPVGALDHDVGLGETGGEVAALAHLRFPDHVAALVDGRRRWVEGGLVVDDKRQHLVLDLDRPDGVDGLQRGLRGDGGDLLALVAAVGVEEPAGRTGHAASTTGMSAPGDSPVSTARTPGIFSALLVSIFRTLAWACGQRRMAPCSISGRETSWG